MGENGIELGRREAAQSADRYQDHRPQPPNRHRNFDTVRLNETHLLRDSESLRNALHSFAPPLRDRLYPAPAELLNNDPTPEETQRQKGRTGSPYEYRHG
jgi:hypothetical protein